ncbi:MAG: phosphotransferase [Planctomycetota bacterium]
MSDQPPLAADRPLNTEKVSATLEQFEDLPHATPVLLGSGWDHDAYQYGGHVFRFPRRANVVPFVERERKLLRLINQAVTLATPVVTHVGRPTAAFPYPFLGYQHIAGESGYDETTVDTQAFAPVLGRTLAELHGIERAVIPEDVTTDRATPKDALSAFDQKRSLLRELIPADIVDLWEPYFANAVEPPEPTPQQRFIHGDCSTEHFIFDADGRAVGMIDFTDARMGDPASDFVIGQYFFGDEFTATALRTYADAGGFIDDGLHDRVRWHAHLAPLDWLCEAIEYDAVAFKARPDAVDNLHHVGKHQDWLRRHAGHVRRAQRLGR